MAKKKKKCTPKKKLCPPQLRSEKALEKLKCGNRRYQKFHLYHPNLNQKRRNDTVCKQCPYAIVIGCADSRVIPEMVFDVGIGDIFTVRVAGNVANISSIASIEFAVSALNVELIVVLGHESCGAVKAAIEGGNNGYNLNVLTSYIKPAVEKVVKKYKEPLFDQVIIENAINTAKDLVEKSTILNKAVRRKKRPLRIIPAYYHLKSGKVEFIEVRTQSK